MNFGELAKDLRIARRLTLRDFCAEVGVDPSNWSKVERGIIPPPGDEKTQAALADFFGLKGESRQDFFDLTALARRELPRDLASDEELLAKLPAFFRTARGKDPDGERLKEFVEQVRKLHSPDK